MTQAVNSPIIVLFEDRPKQRMIFQLNLSIYLDARVIVAANLQDLSKALSSPDGVHLVISRAQFEGHPLVNRLADLIQSNGIPIPILCMGEEKERAGVTILSNENEVKPMLQSCAKFLGITARHMVSKKRPDKYEIMPEFLKLLFTFPCDIFERKGENLVKIFSLGDSVPRARVSLYAKKKKPLTIDAVQRLKLVNAVTEQGLKATSDLENVALEEEKKMSLLSASVDMVAAQFQNSGMDEETVNLANASIKAIEKIAESAPNVNDLVKQLMASEGGYRYAHCQLITFLGFHVIKMMGWWGEEQRNILSQAAFFHDISLLNDDEAHVKTTKQITDSETFRSDAKSVERILSHPQLAARELQTSPDINPEVVRIVIQHHGSPLGKGFSTDIGKFDNLTKTFILCEEWADYLIALADTDEKANPTAKMAELKGIYKEEQCQQIIETFRYLDSEEFKMDFLSTDEVDLALGRNMPELVEEASFNSGSEEDKSSQTIEGVTDHITDGKRELIGGSEEDKSSQTIEGVTEIRKDEIQVIKGGGPQGEVVTVIKGDKSKNYVDNSITKIKSDPKEKERELKMKALAGSTDLMKAALSGSLEEVTNLLKENAQVNLRKTDADGRTAIHYAAMGGSIPVLTYILEKSQQLNTADSKRRSSLFFAALYKKNEAFDYLLAQGAKINQQAMGGMTIAMVGASTGNMHVLKIAVEKGVRIDTKDHSGKTAMDLAKAGKHKEAIAYLESITKKPGAPAAAIPKAIGA